MSLSTEGFGSGFMSGFKVMGDYFDKKRERERQEAQDQLAQRQEARLAKSSEEVIKSSQDARNKTYLEQQMRQWNHEQNRLVQKHAEGGKVSSQDFLDLNKKYDDRLQERGIKSFRFADQHDPERFAAVEDSIKMMGELANGDADVYKSGVNWRDQDKMEERAIHNLNTILHRDINNGFGEDKRVVGLINGEEIGPEYAGAIFAEVEYTDPETGSRVTAPLTWDRSNDPDDNPRPISVSNLMNRIGGEYVVGKMAKNGRDLLVKMGLEKDEEKEATKAAKATALAKYEAARDEYNDASKSYAKAATDFKKSDAGQQRPDETPEEYLARINMSVAEAFERYRDAAVAVNAAEATYSKLDKSGGGKFGTHKRKVAAPEPVEKRVAAPKNRGNRYAHLGLDMAHEMAKADSRADALARVSGDNAETERLLSGMTQREKIAWWQENADRITKDLPSDSVAYIANLIFGKE